MIVTDASIWVSVLHHNDIYRNRTHTWLNEYIISGGEIVAPTLLIAEVSGAIARRTDRSYLGHSVSNELFGYTFLKLYDLDHKLARVAGEMAADYRLRGADAVYAALAHTLKVPLLTWDSEQMTRVQPVVRAGQPGTDFGNNGHGKNQSSTPNST